MSSSVDIITIDGPSGTGKGTIARLIAEELGFHLLDSGALYRLLGLAARQRGVNFNDPPALAALAERLDLRFEPDSVSGETRTLLDGAEVTDLIRTEEAGRDASLVAAIGPVRQALLERQRVFARPPGLVADGRDMGTVVFPAARVKIFLTASLEERARRRYKQLRGKGIAATLDALSRELAERDARDSARAVAPLKPADDAHVIDTTGLGIDEVVAEVRRRWQAVAP